MIDNLKISLNEKDVENHYRSELLKNFEEPRITSPYGVDGLLESKNVRALLEFKYEENLKNKLSQCNILIQCLYYLKKFESAGDKLPSVIFVGDINECFAIHTNSIIKYLSHDIDWKIAPSESHKRNPSLIQAMVSDNDIIPFIHNIDDTFDIKGIVEKIKDLSDNVIRKIRITQHNIVTIFDYFEKNVLSDKVKLSTNEKANLFIQIIINPNENYLHPKKKNVLITKSFGDITISHNSFISFFQHFEGDVYSPKEKEGLTGLVDRLIEDTTRRMKGEFFTPTPFVDLAHKYISDTFGEDWRERFVVWDCAWGTGNLTRDYKFKELYCSTLEQSDIDTANQMRYNNEAVKFQYDFLNDGFDNEGNMDIVNDPKLPQGLKDAILGGKEILFLINPPYGTSANFGETSKEDISKNYVNSLMKKENWGEGGKNLYPQFLYRISKYSNVKISVFSPPLFLTGSSFKQFRSKFFKNMNIKHGFLFEASHFSDVSDGWGIVFSLIENIRGGVNEFIYDRIELTDIFDLTTVGTKVLYNTDNEISATNFCKIPLKKIKTIDTLQLKNPITPGFSNVVRVVPNMLFYIDIKANNIESNSVNVSLFSTARSNRGGFSVIKENFHKVVSLFTARKSITPTWINCKDEYLAPNEEHELYEQFTHDSIVYSLFNNSSQQSSLRQITYKEKLWDIKNEFFWLSKNDIQQLAEENHYDELYKDSRTSDERFVYKKLFEEGIYDKLSPDAKEVLDIATNLLKKSIGMRKIVSEEHPEYHLDSWDAGYAQLKLVWKEYYKDDFKVFRDKYKALEDRMRPLVYELGFLRK